MSASKEKKLRIESKQAGTYVSQAEIQKAKDNKRFRRNTIIVVIAVVLILAVGIVVNSNLFYTKMPAVTLGDESFSVVEFNYYYRSAYSSIYNSYGSLMDSETPLTDQYISEPTDEDPDGMTWADYLTNQATSNMVQITGLYNDAVEVGFTLNEEQLAEVDESIATYESSAEYYGYTLDGFLALNFGKGMDEELLREIVTRDTIASYYYQKYYQDIEYTDEELEEYYQSNKDGFDTVYYLSFTINSTDSTFDGMEEDAIAAAALEQAQAIAAATTPEEFAELCTAYAENTDGTEYLAEDLEGNAQGNSLPVYYSEWLLDADRVANDTYATQNDSGTTYAVMFLSRDDNHYNTVSVRHILFSAEADENGDITDEALTTAYTEAQNVYTLWQENPTEEYFIELAEEYSSDEGSNENGGLYDSVYKGEMVEQFDEFCFAGHEPGDTDLIYGESSSYAGYHIIYFVGENDELYSNVLAQNSMLSDDIDAYLEAFETEYPVTTTGWMRFADLGING